MILICRLLTIKYLAFHKYYNSLPPTILTFHSKLILFRTICKQINFYPFKQFETEYIMFDLVASHSYRSTYWMCTTDKHTIHYTTINLLNRNLKAVFSTQRRASTYMRPCNSATDSAALTSHQVLVLNLFSLLLQIMQHIFFNHYC